mmetsp:Transcript_16090/g.25039  ORF Transcript_16090/g.25039 Transcript_16090/m.25039 type:complete len:86 (-) Transcript_16090:2763-3020(-)
MHLNVGWRIQPNQNLLGMLKFVNLRVRASGNDCDPPGRGSQGENKIDAENNRLHTCGLLFGISALHFTEFIILSIFWGVRQRKCN